MLPFKDQRSANSARRQLGELGRKIGIDIRPVYTSRKIGHDIKPKEKKPKSLSNNALFTITSVVCAMQTTSGIRADTSISALRNTKDRLQSGITLKSNMEQSQVTYIVILRS